jgi:hypothetical protein
MGIVSELFEKIIARYRHRTSSIGEHPGIPKIEYMIITDDVGDEDIVYFIPK